MTQREKLYNKYNGRCGYSGTLLEDDWQIDHIVPLRRGVNEHLAVKFSDESNLIPCQRLINHYKHSLTLDLFRDWYLKDLHLRLRKLPKNPKAPKVIKRKQYLLAIAKYFGIDEETPFSGIFYFETLK